MCQFIVRLICSVTSCYGVAVAQLLCKKNVPIFNFLYSLRWGLDSLSFNLDVFQEWYMICGLQYETDFTDIIDGY